MIENIKIKDFEWIKKFEIKKLARVNLFVGKNGCGKTTILKYLFQMPYGKRKKFFSHNVYDSLNSDTEDIHDTLDILKKIDKNIIGYKIVNNEKIFFNIDTPGFIPIFSMGSGIQRFTEIILALNSKKYDVILIDGVENGLYIDSQVILFEEVFSAAKKNNVQIFASTHSQDALWAVTQAYKKVFGEVKDDENDKEFRLFRIRKDSPEKFRVSAFSSEGLQIALKENWEVR